MDVGGLLPPSRCSLMSASAWCSSDWIRLVASPSSVSRTLFCTSALRARISAICQHTSAYVSIRQHTSAYVSIRQHTSADVRTLFRISALRVRICSKEALQMKSIEFICRASFERVSKGEERESERERERCGLYSPAELPLREREIERNRDTDMQKQRQREREKWIRLTCRVSYERG